jgi:hypothetical protein
MGTERRLGTKLPKWADKTSTTGLRLDAGPYVGVIKNNLDPTKSGRLQVFIPDLGGDEDNVQNWRTVSYASPFFGATNQPEASKSSEFDKVHHTYGMWMVPPDIGNEVLCTFVNGDPGRGYWFACVNKHLSHVMLPAVGTNGPFDTSKVKSTIVKNALAQKTTPTLPAAEFNENEQANISSGFLENKKAIHEAQAEILIKQGLDRDPVRGAITTSSQRETPSQVFGISTPGRPAPGQDPALDPNYTSALSRGEIDETKYSVRSRVGGHSFVMDDGEIETGRSQLMRLRTASGHQLLMSDTERLIYIANSDGSVWLEFSGSGQISAYAGGGINIRTDGDFNFHADGNINMHAGKSFNLRADGGIIQDSPKIILKATDSFLTYGGKVEIGSGGNLLLSADSKGEFTSDGPMILSGSRTDINTRPGTKIKDPGSIKVNQHNDTVRESDEHPWQSAPGQLSSIVRVAPSHEPWPRLTGIPQGQPARGGEEINAGPAPAKVEIPVGEPSGDPGPDSAQGQAVKGPLDPGWMNKPDAPNPPGGVGPLSQYETKCLMAQIAFSESAWNYRARNSLNYVGRYQTGAAALTDAGYIKMEYFKQYRNGAVNNDGAWTGKDSINNLEDYFNNKGVQESVMYSLMQSNYKTMVRIGAIKTGDSKETVAGMIQVAHLLGAGGAKSWRFTAGGADANGTTGAVYYNKARYAVNVLAGSGTSTA